MYVKRVVLRDVRGFEKLDFSFERSPGVFKGWTVITGDNASGKTALLKSISLALVGVDCARVLQPFLKGWVRKGGSKGRISVQLVAGSNDRFASGRRYEKPFWSELEISNENTEIGKISPTKIMNKKGHGPSRGPWLDSPEGWFCVGYGPFRRLYGHSPEAQRIMSSPGKVSRFATMFREDATLAEGDIWLRDLNYKHLEKNETAQRELDIVKKILNSDFLLNGMTVEKIDSQGLSLRQANGVSLYLEDMSDGYRAAIAMLVDILKQIISVYGTSGVRESEDGKLSVTNSGVVLIDEVDAHLHPSWQRVIGEWFTKVLPNIQFIVTTHSPLICQAADNKGLFHLPPPGSGRFPFQISDLDYQHIIAGRPNKIFTSPLFGLENTRSPRSVKAREEYSLLKSKEIATRLSSSEKIRMEQLSLFAVSGEDDA